MAASKILLLFLEEIGDPRRTFEILNPKIRKFEI